MSENDINPNATGCVYFIKMVDASNNVHFKIGRTEREPLKRLAELQTGCPFKLKMFDHIITDDTSSLEGLLHKKFGEARAHGEWFSIDEKRMSEIVRGLRSFLGGPNKSKGHKPWDDANPKIVKGINLRLPEPLWMKLDYLKKESSVSIQKIIESYLLPGVELSIQKIDAGESRDLWF